jgi:hypothetical protein
MNYKLLIILLTCIFSARGAAAIKIADLQQRFVPDTIDKRASLFWDGLAQSPTFGRPFWADMHSTLTRGEVAYATNSTDYDWAGKDVAYRAFVFANLGADLPLWSGNFDAGKYGVSVTLPFLIDVWLDMFERTTAPVINTGYRFGAFEIGFIHRLEKPFWRIKNYALRLSPLKHECTHIGDELTIARMNEGLKVTRINVSYNYAELMLTINDPDGSLHRNHAFRFGLLVLHDFGKGYYDILPQEADESVVEPSHRPFEYYLQYQYQSRLLLRNLQAIASVEMRSRERYNYPFSYSGRLQDYWDEHPDLKSMVLASPDKVCVNVFLGLRYNNPKSKAYYSKIGIGFRYYGGINPYGQFRSQPRYSQWGLSLMFE